MFKPQKLAWVLAALYFIFNLGFFSYDYDMDGSVFSLYLEAVKGGAGPGILFHTHHMIYEPLGYLFWSLLLIGIPVRSVLALQLFDLVLSAISLAVFAQALLIMAPEKKWPALVCELGLGFSFSYWFFSVQPGELTLAILFLNLGFYFMVKTGRKQNEIMPPVKKVYIILVLGVVAALALFGHIMHGLFFLPVLVFALRIFKGPKGLPRLWPLVAVILVAAFITGSLYAIVFLSKPGAGLQEALPETFVKWVLGNANTETPYGYMHSYWETIASGPGQWFSGLAWAFFWKQDKTFQPSIWGALKVFSLLAIAVFIGGYILHYLKDLRQRQIYDDVIMAWVMPGAVFTAFWASGYFEQKTYLLPALWAMIFLGAPWTGSFSKKTAVTSCLALAVASLFAVNFATKIHPDSNPDNVAPLKIAEQIKAATGPDSVVIISGAARGYNIGKVYIPYFSQRGTVVLDWVLGKPVSGKYFPENLEQTINDYRSAGKPVYLLSDALQAPALEELSQHHRINKKELASFWSRYKLRSVAKLEGGLLLYQLE